MTQNQILKLTIIALSEIPKPAGVTRAEVYVQYKQEIEYGLKLAMDVVQSDSKNEMKKYLSKLDSHLEYIKKSTK
jgi:hypothetical protein